MLEALQSQFKARPNKKGKEARAARQAGATEAAGRQLAALEPSVKAKGKGNAVPKAKQYVSIDDVKASDTCPGVFHVQARVVDFFPDNLRDCIVLQCTSCKEMYVPNYSLGGLADCRSLMIRMGLAAYQRRGGCVLSATTRWRTSPLLVRSTSYSSASQTTTGRPSMSPSQTNGCVVFASSSPDQP